MSSLACGIVGLPNVGKSTLFNALTKAKAPASNYPFCTIDPNVGIVTVYDPRLEFLSKLSKSQKIIYATMKFVDIAGLVRGASQGEGLGNQFLSHIREMDAIVHVVRCFEDDEVVHVEGKIDPLADIETVNLELMLSDLQTVQNIYMRLEKQARGKKEMQPLLDLFRRLEGHLLSSHPVKTLPLTPEEQELLKPYPFLTQKKVLYVANVSEKELPSCENEYVARLRAFAAKEGNEVLSLCVRFEAEIAEVESAEEQKGLLEAYGLSETGLDRLVRASFHLLGLITYLTTGEIETRAWTIRIGDTAYDAAGKIHTDIQQRFVRAEVIAYNDMVTYGGRTSAKEAGKLRYESKDYLMQDGDVVHFL